MTSILCLILVSFLFALPLGAQTQTRPGPSIDPVLDQLYSKAERVKRLQVLLREAGCEPNETIRQTEVDGVRYYVHYSWSSCGFLSVPATNPPGYLHYQAKVSIYRDGVRETIVKDLPAMFTKEGCWEDDPAALVDQAKELLLQED